MEWQGALKVAGEQTTSPQHNLNDLRHNLWVADRIGRQQTRAQTAAGNQTK
jgi:hypothetical protein